MPRAVAIDSNALTYLLDAHQPGYDPSTDRSLGQQRLAMIRTLFYSDRWLWVGPTVEAEYRRIRIPERYDDHRRMAQYVLQDQPLRVDAKRLEARVHELRSSHPGEADCQVVAETEFAGLDTLLTCDADLLGAFIGVSTVKVLQPSEFWKSLEIRAGSEPVRSPALGHPLFGKTWWRIGKADKQAKAQKPVRIEAVSPTVLRSGPYRFFFFSSDRAEPPHIHVARERKTAKFWLQPVRLEYNFGFASNELNKVSALVQEHQETLLKAWHDYFKSGNGNRGGQAR